MAATNPIVDPIAQADKDKANTAPAAPQSSGIVSSAAAYKAPTTTPITTNVDADQETVESRLNKLTAKGSEYTNLAASDASRRANSRGLINSGMAAASGTEAAIRSALPIAQQDAKTYTDTRLTNQNTQNDFLKNEQSANLNKDVAAHGSALKKDEQTQIAENELTRDAAQSGQRMNEEEFATSLKTQSEQILNDAKFSDEIKLQYVNAINTIVRDAQQQVTDIGLSDRSAAQQAEAIRLATINRDAQLAVYQDLLSSFPDWSWSADFTPGVATGGGPSAVAQNEAQVNTAPVNTAPPPVTESARFIASLPPTADWASGQYDAMYGQGSYAAAQRAGK